MAAIAALRSTLSALGRTPVLFLAGLLYGVIVLPQSALRLAGVSAASTLLQILTFFVTPFVVAGFLGMASESLDVAEGTSSDRRTDSGDDDDTSLSTLARVGKERYVPLLVGNVVEFVIVVVFVVLAALLAVVAAVGLFGTGGGAAAGGGAMIAVAVAAAVVLAFLLLNFFIQFYSVAIVVGGTDALDGFRESYRLVRDNLLSTLGYSLITLVVSLLTTVPVTGFVFWRTFQTLPRFQDGGAPMGPGAGAGGFPGGAGGMSGLGLSTQEIVLLSLVSLVTTVLLFTVQRTYATAFYRMHEPRSRPEDFADAGEFEDGSEESTL